MSAEEVTSRKAKKAQRDAERKKAGKKRKREEGEGQKDELKDDFIPLAGGAETTVAESTGELSKKRKVAEETIGQDSAVDGAPSAPKAKKRKKSKPSSADAKQDVIEGTSPAEGDGDTIAISKASSKNRFILFIGNLPFTATDATITTHFKSIQPFTLRHRVDPKTKKSKGFAFLEFENYDRMKTCLKLYHHSVFDPAGEQDEGAAESAQGERQRGKKKDKSRRINVELTAGGGGKGEERKEKIKAKNAKLEEERKRRREAEEKAAARKKKQGLKKTGANAEPKVRGGQKGREEVGESGEGMQGVHPARLARMKT